jgi:outer membrane lipoprotein carrier protein
LNHEHSIAHGLSFNVITLEKERLTNMGGKNFIILSIAMLIYLFSTPMAFGITGETVLSEIQNRYEKTNEFEANFVQEYVSKMMRQPNKAEGKVYFKKKGMMRWDYTVPNQKFISNGHTLWYYQPEEKQVLVSDISSVLKEKTPLAFLAGEGNLKRDFKLINLNESISEKEDNYILELAPKEPLANLTKLILTVDKKTYYVIQADVFDELGNVTRTRFIDIKTNIGLSNSFFHFAIPPGTEVIKM